MKISSAIILSAGLGTRMRPLTLNTPKPLIPVAGKPLLARHLDYLQESGVSRRVVNVHYLPDKMKNFLHARQDPELLISYEQELLETGGGIAKALPLLQDDVFIAANSDALCIDPACELISRLEQEYAKGGAEAVLVLVPSSHASGYDGAGDFFYEDNLLRRRGDAAHAPYVFTGLQLLSAKSFTDIPEGPFSMNVIYNRLLESGKIRAVIHQGDWLHIGDIDGLAKAEDYYIKTAA